MDAKVIGLIILVLTICSAKKSHPHKHHLKKIADTGNAKSIINGKPKAIPSNTNATGKSTISKKQSLGMPLNNMDEQGLGGEPVGHLDASEGVGGLGGDQDGIPIGMGAGAEPLGMAKGKGGMPNGMEENGGGMQGLNEENENIHQNEDVARPFQEQQGGDFIEGGHGTSMMSGHSSNFMPSSSNDNPMNMMGGSNGGGVGGGGMGMNNFMGNGEEGGEHGGNFMEHESDGGDYRGPKKDPLGGVIKPFNDEYKNSEGEPEGHSMHHGGDSSHGMSFSPMHEEGEEHMGGGEHDFNGAPNAEANEMMNGNLPEESEMGKSGPGDTGGNFMGHSNDDESYRGPKKDPLGGDIKPFSDEHKNDGMGGGDDEERGDQAMNFMGHKSKGFSKEPDSGEHTGSQGGGETDFANPSPSDIGKALNGNLAALDSVNIQGDSDVAEMVRKATHQKEFSNNDSGTFNGISLMEPGYSSTTKQFFGGNGRLADRRTKKGSRTAHAHAKNTVTRNKRRKLKNLN